MAIEFEDAPKCCKDAMRKIYSILDAGDYLAQFLAIAPSLSLLGPRVSVLGALWRLGKAGVSWNKNRRTTSGVVARITRNRVLTIIDSQILRHLSRGESELEKHWRLMRTAY